MNSKQHRRDQFIEMAKPACLELMFKNPRNSRALNMKYPTKNLLITNITFSSRLKKHYQYRYQYRYQYQYRHFASYACEVRIKQTPYQNRPIISPPSPSPVLQEMEINRNPSPESESIVTEDFVHVHNPNNPDIAMDESEQIANPDISQEPNPNRESIIENSPSLDSGSSDDAASASSESESAPMDPENNNRVLSEELSKGVVILECESRADGGICKVYLVGTSHVSQESCREVQAVISYLKPQLVFLELCSSRVGILTTQNVKVPTMRKMISMWRKNNNAFGIVYSWFLAKVANKLEVFPGSEFRVAYEEAIKYGGKVMLGDRPFQITLRRTWGKMKLRHKVKLLYGIVFQAIFLPSSEDISRMLTEMDDVDMITLIIQEMSKQFPTLMETLVHERDLYMASTLRRAAHEHTSVVAVVGKGHLGGITKNWKKPIEVKHLLEIPRESRFSFARILKLSAAVAGVAIVSGIYFAGRK